MNKNMRAMVLEQTGSPLVLRSIPVPLVKKNQVLVKVMASGVNPLDLKIRDGKAAHAKVEVPAVPGIDMAGIVTEIGEEVTRFKAGDKMFGMVGGVGMNQGTLAEYIAVDEDHLSLMPEKFSMKQAAAIPLVFITAWEGLVDRAKVHEGQKVLVHGGAGGVGYMAIQIAMAFGATVYATDAADGLDLIKALGATPIDYNSTTPEAYIKQYTDAKGFDIVFDTVGGQNLDNSFRSVKKYTGHVISSLGWGTHSLAPLSFLGATYSGIFTLLPLLTGNGKLKHGEILREAAKMVDAGKLIALVSPKTYHLEDANEAYHDLENRVFPGKPVIEVNINYP